MLSMLSKTVAFNTSTEICRTSRLQNEMKYANLAMKKSMLFHSVLKLYFHKDTLKTFIRALDKVIIYIAILIYENYNNRSSLIGYDYA